MGQKARSVNVVCRAAHGCLGRGDIRPMGASCTVGKSGTPECLEMFSFKATSAEDRSSAMQQDFANANLDLRVLKRISVNPLTSEESQVLSGIFEQIDSDNNQAIDAAELRAYFQSHNQIIKQDELEEIIRLSDKDGNGRLDGVEFKRFAKRILDASKCKR